MVSGSDAFQGGSAERRIWYLSPDPKGVMDTLTAHRTWPVDTLYATVAVGFTRRSPPAAATTRNMPVYTVVTRRCSLYRCL